MGRPYGTAEWERREMDAPCFAGARDPVVAVAQPGADLETALRASEERYRYTVALSPLIPWIADSDGNMIDIDVRGLEYTGLSYDACMGSGFLSAIHPTDRAVVKAAWKAACATGMPCDYEIRIRHRDGSYRWHRSRAAPRQQQDGKILLWYGTIEDIDARRAADDSLRWTADHDDLTGLWNRRAFMQGLSTALAGIEGTGVEVALLLVDLDGFKSINDRFGHDVGDAFLKEVALRLDRSGTGDAMAGRLGGDEFALFAYTPDRASLDQVIAELKASLTAPWSFNGQTHTSRASIGVAVSPAHGTDPDTLYKCADLALYEAKTANGGVRFFRSTMRAGLQARIAELSRARRALDHDQIHPYYQPKVDVRSGMVVGFEALLRWRHDTQGIQAPDTIPAAFQDVQLAMAMDERMFERVAADIASWRRHGIDFGRIAINVSAAEFRQEDFAARLLARIKRSRISPSSIELEVTETVLLGHSTGKTLETFEKVRDAGMTIALDDFGTGHASLIHLKHFPVDALKIDRSFVQNLTEPINGAIVRAIVSLGRDLGITTVAEGVETQFEADQLYRNGCDQVQGFLFSPAVPAEDVPDLVSRRWSFCCPMIDERLYRAREPKVPSCTVPLLVRDGAVLHSAAK